jgi:diguanylate cyclase (GGDEF)-like protein/PAS domain S-box-containing protein
MLPSKLVFEWILVLAILILSLLIINRIFGQTRHSFQQTATKWNLILTIGLVLVILTFNSFTLIREYQTNSHHIQERLMDKASSLVRQRVSFVQDFIEQEKATAENRLKERLKQHVDLAFQSVRYVIENTRGKGSQDELTRLVMETLRPIRHSNGRGYMFATRMDGIELLFADRPEFEGRNMLELKDADGVYYVREMIRLCRQQGEGFVAYRISKPGSPSWDHHKLAYVRYIKELDCFIGTGDYLEDFTAGVKQEVAERLDAIQFSGDLSIFGGDFDGMIVFGPLANQNMIDVTDRNGVKVVQELINAAQTGGGFVRYQMPETADSKEYPKLSYSAPVPDWNWYIGAGINLDHAEAEHVFAQRAMEDVISGQILETAALVPIAALIFLLVGRRLATRVDQNIRVLKDSLDQAALHDLCINTSQIEFEEFVHIAEAANRMLHERQLATRDLREREENLSVTLDSIGDAVIVTDARGRVTRMNPVAEQLTGWPMTEAAGRDLAEIFPIANAHTGAAAENPVHKVFATGKIVGMANHTVLSSRDGTQYQIADSAAPILTSDGTVQGVILVFRDITEEYALNQALKESEARFRAMFDNAPLLVALANRDGNMVFVNEQWSESTGFGTPDLLGLDIGSLMTGADKGRFQSEFKAIVEGQKTIGRLDTNCLTRQGQPLAIDLSLAPLADENGRVKLVLSMAKDVTERRTQEKKLEWLALHDDLTGLANRACLLKFIEQLLAGPETSPPHWLFLFDLDRFKSINDNYGHATGDAMLRETGLRLFKYGPAQGLAARLSGDEFVIVAPLATVAEVNDFACRLRDLIRQPVQCVGLRLQVETSIGAVPVVAENASEVLRRADLAMYQVKRNRSEGGFQLYNDQLDKAVQRQRRLEEDLKNALENPQQFVLHYQPIWSLKEGTLKGAEALVRWQHPTLGLLPPDQFIPLAEERAHIVPLGKIVLKQACRDLHQWTRDLPLLNESSFRISVNMAPQQLMTADLVESVAQDLAHHQINAEKICLEITETALMEDPSLATRHIIALQKMGISIAIDDFGTGYSSLSYLNQFNVNTIKLDRSLVKGIDEPGTAKKVSAAVIRLAHDLQLKVVAEGVETTSQLDVVNDLGCDYIQGFLTGRPIAAADLWPLLQANRCAILHN